MPSNARDGSKGLLRSPVPSFAAPAAGDELELLDAFTWGPVLVVRQLFDQLGLWEIFDGHSGRSKGVSHADRAFVLLANRLICPSSEHGLAGWLETDFVCDRRQFKCPVEIWAPAPLDNGGWIEAKWPVCTSW